MTVPNLTLEENICLMREQMNEWSNQQRNKWMDGSIDEWRNEWWSVAGMLGQPESPRWLVQKNRTSEAEQSARKLWGSDGASQLGDSKSGGALPAACLCPIHSFPADIFESYDILLT